MSVTWSKSILLVVFLQLTLFTNTQSSEENDAYAGLTWFLQISDIHISYKHPDRIQDFREFVGNYLKIYNPDVVICSGDLTDAKILRGLSSEQVESEWKDYYEAVSSRRPVSVPWLDIRGNHDNLNVLNRTSKQNYFRNYSSSGLKGNLESYKYSISLRGQKYNFIALDATQDVGMRFPFNFVGDISASQQKRIKNILADVKEEESTIFFGHYPSSTVRQKQFLLSTVDKGLVYLCGHLHDLSIFRMQDMYSLHGHQTLELELVDWKWNRAYRLLAVDQGYLSFTDVRFGQWPVILPTLPKNSQFLMKSKEPDFDLTRGNEIRTLVFSSVKIKSVTCYVDDGEGIKGVQQAQGPLYTCKWKPTDYRTGLHTLKIVATDSLNRTKSSTHSFTLDKDAAIPFSRWFPKIVLGASFPLLFQTLFGVSAILSISFLPLLLLTSKLVSQRRLPEKVVPVFQYILQCCCFRKSLIITSVRPLFYFFTFYPAFLAVGPWVVGTLIEDSNGAVFAWGVYVDNQFIYTQVGYFKFALQALFIHPTILLACGHILEYRAYSSGVEKCHILKHILMSVVFCFAVYLFLFESILFWLQFGTLGIMFGVLSTWSLIFYSIAIFWSFRVERSEVHTSVIVEDHGKKTDDEEEL